MDNRQTRVKICGITNLADARFVSGAMADFIGFIFWPGSPRFVTAETAAEIIGWVEGPKCVGVFVDQPAEEVNHMAETSGINLIQLHGNESVDYCRKMKRPVIKSFRIKADMTMASLENMISPYLSHVDYILFDSYDQNMPGGTGKTFDWKLVGKIKEQVPVFLAGGLTAQNIAQAIITVQPFAVDVSSGVERKPGTKDFEKITEFFEQIDFMDEQKPY